MIIKPPNPKTFECFSQLPTELQQKIWKFKVEEEIDSLPKGRVIKLMQRRLKKTTSKWQQMNDIDQSNPHTIQTTTLPETIDLDTISSLTRKEMLALGHTWHSKGTQEAPRQELIAMYSPQSLPPTIAALRSVCYGARLAVEKTYTFACGLTKPTVIFNFERDTLYLSYKDFHVGSSHLDFHQKLLRALDAGKEKDWRKVKFLALELPVNRFRGVGEDKDTQLPFQPFIAEILRYFPGLIEFSVVLGDYAEDDEKDNLVLFEPIDLLTACSALDMGHLEYFEDFESYDYDAGQDVRPRYRDDLDPLVGGIYGYAKYVETIGEPPLEVPDLDRLFTKIVIGNLWEERLEDSRQRYLAKVKDR